MKKILLFLLISSTFQTTMGQSNDTRYFELRTYHCNENKRNDLIQRFQNHTFRLFEKAGIENIAYFIPEDDKNYTLSFILAYPDEKSRDLLWNKFASDPEWQKVLTESEINGPLVFKVDQVFMNVARELQPEHRDTTNLEEKIFELRTYHCYPGKLEDINARFRDHTMKLFEKHGMTNVIYWYTAETNGEQSKLVYLLAHKDVTSAKDSFSSFRNDPEWIRVRDNSESNGKIVERVESVYLKALDFSPLK